MVQERWNHIESRVDHSRGYYEVGYGMQKVVDARRKR